MTYLSLVSPQTHSSLIVTTVPPFPGAIEARIASFPALPWHLLSDVHSTVPTAPDSDARLLTWKLVLPPDTVYFEMIQLGMVNDLSVHRPLEGQVGTAGMSMARALTANAATRSNPFPILTEDRSYEWRGEEWAEMKLESLPDKRLQWEHRHVFVPDTLRHQSPDHGIQLPPLRVSFQIHHCQFYCTPAPQQFTHRDTTARTQGTIAAWICSYSSRKVEYDRY